MLYYRGPDTMQPQKASAECEYSSKSELDLNGIIVISLSMGISRSAMSSAWQRTAATNIFSNAGMATEQYPVSEGVLRHSTGSNATLYLDDAAY